MASFIPTPSKYTGATIPVVANFISQLLPGEAVTAILTSAIVDSGIDPTPENILNGNPTLAQNVATQSITGGLEGVTYLVGFNATTNIDNRLVIYTYISVLSSNPFQATA